MDVPILFISELIMAYVVTKYCLQLSWFFISFLSPAVFLMNSKNLWVKMFLWISLKTTWQWNSPASNMLQKSLTVFVLADRRKIPSTSKPASHKTKSWAHALILYRILYRIIPNVKQQAFADLTQKSLSHLIFLLSDITC